MTTGRREPTFGNYRHGGTTENSKSPEYITWSGMHDRCRNPKNKRFAQYGGRGIAVCERWQDFAVFREDMGARPSSRYTIDRIDNDRGYEPGNCRWATRLEQNSNQRHTRTLVAFGRRQSMSAWAREIGITRESLRDRLAKGMSVEDAVSKVAVGHGFRGRRP
jgi:hypothetical protein